MASSEASDVTSSATIMPRSMSKEDWLFAKGHQVECSCVKELDLFCRRLELPHYCFGKIPALETVCEEPEVFQGAEIRQFVAEVRCY